MRVASDPSFLRSLINHSVYPIDLLGAPAETEASHWFVNHSRLLQIMSFAKNSGMIDSVHRTRELYGRVTQFHLAAERNGVHSDKLMD